MLWQRVGKIELVGGALFYGGWHLLREVGGGGKQIEEEET